MQTAIGQRTERLLECSGDRNETRRPSYKVIREVQHHDLRPLREDTRT